MEKLNTGYGTISLLVLVTFVTVSTYEIDGGWAPWSAYWFCSASCGGGYTYRSRTCSNPANTKYGKFCVGDINQVATCNQQPCPRDGGWSDWTTLGVCSVLCTQSRNRKCNNPPPGFGGSICIGNATESAPCLGGFCVPVNGSWSSWMPSSACSVSCGNGTLSQYRTCTSPAPAGGGLNCTGESAQTAPCAMQACPPVMKKLLVGVGINLASNQNHSYFTEFEVIDLNCIGGGRSNTCYGPSPLPILLTGALGGLNRQDLPFVCGGAINGSDDSTSRECYVLNQSRNWTADASLVIPRAFASFTTLNSLSGKTLLVTGGISNPLMPYNFAEMMSSTSWQFMQLLGHSSTTPMSLFFHCMASINATTVIITGGLNPSSPRHSKKTYYYNTESAMLTPGPTLNHDRRFHSCGKIKANASTSILSIIVAGGEGSNGRRVEFLDPGANAWRQGSNLPADISHAQMVEDQGEVVLVGGKAVFEGSLTSLDYLYRLSDAGANTNWEEIPRRLAKGRHGHLAFLVPDSFVTCSACA